MIEDRESELTEHLDELRTRIIRSLIYLAVGSIAGWLLYNPWLYGFLTNPVTGVLKGRQLLLTNIAEGFMIQFEVALIAGAVFAAPFVIFEAWGFVSPALKSDEKRPVKWVAPLCAALFILGVSMAYFIMPAAMRWFVSYIPPNAEMRPTVGSTIIFMAKMLLAFGIVFEMPVAILLLAKLGIVDSKMLKSKWRYSVVIIAIIAAVATPSSDAFSMTAMAVPLVALYGVSILLVRFVEKR